LISCSPIAPRHRVDEPSSSSLSRQAAAVRAQQRQRLSRSAAVAEDDQSQGKPAQRRIEDYALILSDINTPGMDGLALLHEIKQRWPELRVMMITAYGDDERRRRAGKKDYSQRPADFKR
jgi:CheY-like chemotaxis protein